MDSSVPPLPKGSPWLKSTEARHSLPSDSAKSSERRASNRAKIPPASPEVISSLISSLSAISTPAEDLFDSLLPRTPAGSVPPSPTTSSGFVYTSNAPSTRASLSTDSAQYQDSQNRLYLHPDDAAIPPVIRTSKPPSGFSPLTAPRKTSSTQSTRATGWSTSNVHDFPPSLSIGSVSIEPGPGRSSTSVNTVGSGKPRSGKSLNLKASKERMREIDKGRKKKSNKSVMEDGAKSPTKSLMSETEQPLENASAEKVPSPPVSTRDKLSPLSIPARRTSTYSASSDANSESATSEDRPGGIGGGRTIPIRESSLRHKSGSASPKRKRKSYRHSVVNGEVQLEKHPELPEVDGARDLISVAIDVDEHEDDGVTKRIKELKAQKELRRKELQGHAHSDDEAQRGRDKTREKMTAPGRSSLPAPYAPKATLTPKAALIRSVSDSEAFGKENKDPESSKSLRPAKELLRTHTIAAMPMTPVADRRSRVASNQVSPGVRMTIVDDKPSTADSIDDAVDDYMCASRLSLRIYHPQTGRAIAFSEVGDPSGSVVFCCVGMGTTRYLTAFYDELAISLKLRLITLDRPGIGDSQPYADGSDTPLGWPDDIRAVCQHLAISRFSLLAHSAGAIYALATALRMPQHIRGRIHLLGPWIPPSQMVSIGISQERVPGTSLPYSQRILRSLPTPFLKAANSSFFSLTSNSITTSLPKSPRRTKRRSIHGDVLDANVTPTTGSPRHNRRSSGPLAPRPEASSLSVAEVNADVAHDTEAMRLSEKQRQSEYDSRLTQAIWAAATTNANPAVDLLVCLERRQEIGFRYVDINKAVVIHHGSKDTRVPVENVKWLGKTMRRCEVHVLEGEGHGLMASATVMSSVLGEVAKEWEDWNAVIGAKKGEKRV